MLSRIEARGVLHGFPNFVQRLYGAADSISDALAIGLPGYRFFLFCCLLYLLYFLLSLPARLFELAVDGRGEVLRARDVGQTPSRALNETERAKHIAAVGLRRGADSVLRRAVVAS